MSATSNITITVGWIARHTPKGAGAGGREAAILDIAQDLLLRELHERLGVTRTEKSPRQRVTS